MTESITAQPLHTTDQTLDTANPEPVAAGAAETNGANHHADDAAEAVRHIAVCAFAETITLELIRRGGSSTAESLCREFSAYADAAYVEHLLTECAREGYLTVNELACGASSVYIEEPGIQLAERAASKNAEDLYEELSAGGPGECEGAGEPAVARGDWPVRYGRASRPATPAVLFEGHPSQDQRPQADPQAGHREYWLEEIKGRIISMLRGEHDGLAVGPNHILPEVHVCGALLPKLVYEVSTARAEGRDELIENLGERRRRARRIYSRAISELAEDGKLERRTDPSGERYLRLTAGLPDPAARLDAAERLKAMAEQPVIEVYRKLCAEGEMPEWQALLHTGHSNPDLEKALELGYIERYVAPTGTAYLAAVPASEREAQKENYQAERRRQLTLRARRLVLTLEREGGALTEDGLYDTVSEHISRTCYEGLLQTLARKGAIRRLDRKGGGRLVVCANGREDPGEARARKEQEREAARRAFARFRDVPATEEEAAAYAAGDVSADHLEAGVELVPLEALGESI